MTHPAPIAPVLPAPDHSPTDTVRVAAVSAQGPSSPGFRVRVMLLRSELARYGVRIDPIPLFTSREADAFARSGVRRRTGLLLRARGRLRASLESIGPETEVALIQRQADLLPSLRLERLAASGRRLVWDIDDAIWHDTAREAQGHALAFIKRSRRKAAWLAEHASRIVAANRILAGQLADYGLKVAVVPSLVETREIEVRSHANGPDLTLGWIGSRSTSAYLPRLRTPLSLVKRALSGRRLKLLVVGGDAPSMPDVELEWWPWSPEREQAALARIDVGLMPLTDDPWTRGKSAYKALQYMAAGIPVVADDVGITTDVVEHERSGYVVRTESDWAEAVISLGRDHELRERLGRHGRALVEEHFSVTRWAPRMAAILRDAEHVPDGSPASAVEA